MTQCPRERLLVGHEWGIEAWRGEVESPFGAVNEDDD
jgi:hypothetical protein